MTYSGLPHMDVAQKLSLMSSLLRSKSVSFTRTSLSRRMFSLGFEVAVDDVQVVQVFDRQEDPGDVGLCNGPHRNDACVEGRIHAICSSHMSRACVSSRCDKSRPHRSHGQSRSLKMAQNGWSSRATPSSATSALTGMPFREVS